MSNLFYSHQFDRSSKKRLKVCLSAEVASPVWCCLELDEDVDIACVRSLIARERAEERDTGHPKPFSENLPMCSNPAEDFIPSQLIHGASTFVDPPARDR